MLPTNIKNTQDLMSVALHAERKAIQNYSRLAKKMHDGGNKAAAALFERMILEEQDHERMLLEWMKKEGIEENNHVDTISWHDPNISTTYNKEAQNPDHSSAYRALAFAVHNEEAAFSFYAHVAAHSDNHSVRQFAELLAHEELGHAALLRAERRKAYHAERDTRMTEPQLDPATIHNESDLLAAAIHIDRYLANEMNLISEDAHKLDSLIKVTQQQIGNYENDLSRKKPPGKAITRNLEQLALYNTYMKKKYSSPESGLQRLWACCDRSFSFYDTIVETTENETVMLTAQKLTSSALDRIGILKQILGDSPISD